MERDLPAMTDIPHIIAIYGSPRPSGNTAALLDQAVAGARTAGAYVEKVFLRDLHMSPCLEIYGCRQTGRCVIQDDFHQVIAKLTACRGLMLASPIFFYTVSAHTKILIDRCQSLWVKKYWIDKVPSDRPPPARQGLFIAAGATRGKKLFEGTLLTIKYFFDVLDANLWKSLLYRGLDGERDVLQYPHYLQEAYEAGKELVTMLKKGTESGKE